MHCKKCGRALEKDDRFCSECGSVNPDFYKNNDKTDKTYISDIGLPKKDGDNKNRYSFDDNYGPDSASYSDDRNSGQTISPYADDHASSDKRNTKDKNIPPVYSSEKNTAVGFSNSGSPAAGNRKASKKSVRTAERKRAEKERVIEERRRKKASKKKKLPLIALALTACIGLACAAGFVFGSSKNDNKSNSGYTKSIQTKKEEYDFNPLNDIKEPEVIWETDNIKVTTRRLTRPYDSASYAELQLQVENKTNEKLSLNASKVLINGCDLGSSILCFPEAGNIVTDNITIDLDKMAEMNIENINRIDLWLNLSNLTYVDEDKRISERSDRITIETQNTTVDDIYDGPDKMLYDKSGIKIGYYGKADYRWSINNPVMLRFYYENDTDLNVNFTFKSLSINGNHLDTLFALDHDRVYAHSKGIYDIYVPQKDFEEWGIKDINDINEILFSIKGTEEEVSKEVIFNADDLYTKTPD